MSTLLANDTRVALGPDLRNCISRALFLDRFADAAATEDERKRVFKRALDKSPCPEKTASWSSFLTSVPLLKPASLLYAQLQSRLMVNMAGGVMENAGLLLDRFGLPYIPGSAVKGCARRAALAALREWCETGLKPGATTADHDNLFKAACQDFDSPAAMLAAIARVFGWCEQDWKEDSDFAWACGTAPHRVWQPVVGELHQAFGTKIPDRLAATPWKALPNFAGSVSFLPAYPLDLGRIGPVQGLPLPVPELGKLELDVVTVHHKQYYNEPAEPKGVSHADDKWQRWKREHDAWERRWGTAPDIEEPVPNVFPAVAPGHVFAFALVPLRSAQNDVLKFARTWLQTGLQTFGLGAKTNAGYGWFTCNEALQNTVSAIVRQQIAAAKRAAEEAAARRRAAAEAAAKAQAEAERLAKASPHERFQIEYSNLGDEPFAAQAKKFEEMSEDQRLGFILALKNQKRETAKRWAKKKPELLKPWQNAAQGLNPPVQLP
jgi:CRISPR/Cas system CMR subunit Cmr6 (Cas7 group RAMP superfamily)